MLYRFLTSLKLTLSLLLGLAFVSVFGTLGKVENNRFDLYYQTPWFRILLLLLALNIAACTWKTCKRNLDDRMRFRERLLDEAGKTVADTHDFSVIEQKLKAGKFRLEMTDQGLIGRRGQFGRWGSTIVHVSLLVIMIGGLLAEFGFVGTQVVPAGKSTMTFFDWGVEQEMPLGFEFRVDHFELDYYPIELKIGVYEPQTRELLEEYITKEGETIPLPLPGLSAKVVNFEPFDKSLTLDIYRGNQKVGTYLSFPGEKREQAVNFLDEFLVIKPVAFRDPILKQTHSDVSVLENDRVIKQQRIMINHPLIYKGIAFYQTAHSQDEFGFWYVGFQVSKDPGEPLVWTGSILMVVGLFCAFFIRYRVLLVTGGGVVPLLGFNDPGGQKILEELEGVADKR